VVIFGYPPDKYTLTADYFRSLGDSTEPDQNAEVTNCFRIGYRDPASAMRAVRKNGEVLGGSWMIGAKFAVKIYCSPFIV
jgi:nuclear pore complex protein Nup53